MVKPKKNTDMYLIIVVTFVLLIGLLFIFTDLRSSLSEFSQEEEGEKLKEDIHVHLDAVHKRLDQVGQLVGVEEER